MSYLQSAFFIGVGATMLMDVWGFVRKPLLGIPPPNYALVGRWFGHMFYGRFHHDAIATSASISRELFIGWMFHYLTGIAFAALLVGIWGLEWVQHPTIIPALVVGIGTVLAPFLIMQPSMGAGIAASHTPNPNSARLQSLITHAVFGLGLYVTGKAMHFILTL